MHTEIFSGFGCSILKAGERYFIRYDSGGSASWEMEAEISVADAEKARRSERDACEVLLAIDRRGGGKRVIQNG